MIHLYCMGFCFAIAKQDYKKVVRPSIYFVCLYVTVHILPLVLLLCYAVLYMYILLLLKFLIIIFSIIVLSFLLKEEDEGIC